MSIINEVTTTNAAAMALATALEQVIGNDVILGVSRPKLSAPKAEHLPTGALRIAHLESVAGFEGGMYIVVAESLGVALERLAPDEEMLTALGPVIASTTQALQSSGASALAFDAPEEITSDDLFAAGLADHEFALYTLLDGTERIAAFIIEIGPEFADSADVVGSSSGLGTLSTRANAPARGSGRAPGIPDSVTRHEFEPLNDGMINLVAPRSLSLLHDVEMGVTAELGRKRMTVRDLLSLTPGAVIELDRAAGSPVDVLVNGTLIARGEVVVIDEEFGIRIAEIVAGSEATV